jgi:hypothetical protein
MGSVGNTHDWKFVLITAVARESRSLPRRLRMFVFCFPYPSQEKRGLAAVMVHKGRVATCAGTPRRSCQTICLSKVQPNNHMRLWYHCRVTRAKTQGFGTQTCVCFARGQDKIRLYCFKKWCPLKRSGGVGSLPLPVRPAEHCPWAFLPRVLVS